MVGVEQEGVLDVVLDLPVVTFFPKGLIHS